MLLGIGINVPSARIVTVNTVSVFPWNSCIFCVSHIADVQDCVQGHNFSGLCLVSWYSYLGSGDGNDQGKQWLKHQPEVGGVNSLPFAELLMSIMHVWLTLGSCWASCPAILSWGVRWELFRACSHPAMILSGPCKAPFASWVGDQ